KYEALNAAAAPTSPIRLLIESMRDETALTRERKDAKPGGNEAKKEPATPPTLGAQGISPADYIEKQLKAFHDVVEGDGSRRMMDVILGDLTAINNSLQMIVLNPAQEQQATEQLRSLVPKFQADARRMPNPFGKMLQQAANSFESTIADETYRRIRDDFQKAVYGPCQSVLPGHYPFDRGARIDIGVVEFGKLFGGNGYFDNFFKQNLEIYADTLRHPWKWRQDNAVASRMDPETLRWFERAADIKDAFFSNNPSTPMIILNVT